MNKHYKSNITPHPQIRKEKKHTHVEASFTQRYTFTAECCGP